MISETGEIADGAAGVVLEASEILADMVSGNQASLNTYYRIVEIIHTARAYTDPSLLSEPECAHSLPSLPNKPPISGFS